MNIDDALLDHLMRLAALQIEPERRERLRSQLERIVDYASQLPPLPEEESPPVDSALQALREDVAQTGFTPDQLLKIAPSWDGEFISVPPPLGDRRP